MAVAAVMIMLCYLLPLFLVSERLFGKPGEAIGTYIEGFAAPVLGTLGIVLTFLAFKSQIEFNQVQKEDISRERRQSHVFERIKVIRSSLDNVQLETLKGVQATRALSQQVYITLKWADSVISVNTLNSVDGSYDTMSKSDYNFLFNHIYFGINSEDINEKFRDTGLAFNTTSFDRKSSFTCGGWLKSRILEEYKLLVDKILQAKSKEDISAALSTAGDFVFQLEYLSGFKFWEYFGQGIVTHLSLFYKQCSSLIAYLDSLEVNSEEKELYREQLYDNLTQYELELLNYYYASEECLKDASIESWKRLPQKFKVKVLPFDNLVAEN